MNVLIRPGMKEGRPVRLPSSKSISHRSLIAAALSDGDSVIHNLVANKDTEATMRCLAQLGAVFTYKDDHTLCVRGIRSFSAYDGSVVDCGESGSTLRFLIPLFSLTGREVIFTGHGKLMSRPQAVYEELFRSRGLLFCQEGEFLRVRGALTPGDYAVKGNISSQFISGLLFALPLLKGPSSIKVIPPYESRSYVGLTEDILESAGIRFADEGNTIRIEGNDSYRLVRSDVEGDASQAAFFAELALVSHRPVRVLGISHKSRQGDHVIVSLFESFGGRSVPIEGGYRFEADRIVPSSVDLADCPDLGPALFACAAGAQGDTVFHNCQRLRIKESDRIAAMQEELEKMGARVIDQGNTVTVRGTGHIKGNVTLQGHNDHRIVMALAALSAAADGPVTIQGAQAVEKSYPSFFEDLSAAGAEVEMI